MAFYKFGQYPGTSSNGSKEKKLTKTLSDYVYIEESSEENAIKKLLLLISEPYEETVIDENPHLINTDWRTERELMSYQDVLQDICNHCWSDDYVLLLQENRIKIERLLQQENPSIQQSYLESPFRIVLDNQRFLSVYKSPNAKELTVVTFVGDSFDAHIETYIVDIAVRTR